MTYHHEQRPPGRRDRDRRGATADISRASIPDADSLLWSIEKVALAPVLSHLTLELEHATGRFPRSGVRIGKPNRRKPATVGDRIDHRA